MYDKDILSEKVILKWAEKPLKHRFSCLTDKFLIHLNAIKIPFLFQRVGNRTLAAAHKTN